MDVNIDPDIDPSIESQSGIFSKFSINADFNDSAHHQHDAQDAFMEHQQSASSYANFTIDDQHAQSSVVSAASAATTAAAAVAAAHNLSTIINLSHLQSDRNHNSHDSHSSDGSAAESLKFLQNALGLEHNPSSVPALLPSSSQTTTPNPKQQLIHDSESQVSIVVVNPASKYGSSRLGRPRKHISNNTTNASSAHRNFDQSIVSKFRVDSKPIGGPGSRGGRKNKNGITRKRSEEIASNGKRKIQQHLNFPIAKKVATVVPQNSDKKEITTSDSFILESTEPSITKTSSTLKEIQPKPQQKLLSTSTSLGLQKEHSSIQILPRLRSTALSRRFGPKGRKDIVGGPIVGLFNDYYESLGENDNSELNKVALGYQVKPVSYASDIVFILSFFTKFKIFFQDLPNLGPQDIEYGLKLLPSVEYPLKNVNQVKNDHLTYSINPQDPEISDLMNTFFYKLLTLVLNKKKEVSRSNLPKALIELKSLALMFGLPSEWRDDSEVFNALNVDIEEIIEIADPVDSNNDEYLYSKPVVFGTSKPLDSTPLDNENFEELGLESLSPNDRLILLRSLVQWCLMNSELVRQEITNGTNKQDPNGEKTIYYTSRFIKDGERSIESSNKLAKNLPKKRNKKMENSILEEGSSLNPYTDASVNPLENHLSFRLVDFFAGEGGFNGRFFLVRSADSKVGGFSSVSELKSLSNKSIHDLLSYEQPSRFKLYVQDLNTTLSKIAKDETSTSTLSEALDPWYEIANTSEELESFIDFLTSKLESIKSKNLTNLLNYLNLLLPSLKKFEEIYKDYSPTLLNRASRRKQMNDLKEQDRVLRKLIDENEYDLEEKDFDEGDYLEDQDDDKGNDDFDYVSVVQEDDIDDDDDDDDDGDYND